MLNRIKLIKKRRKVGGHLGWPAKFQGGLVPPRRHATARRHRLSTSLTCLGLSHALHRLLLKTTKVGDIFSRYPFILPSTPPMTSWAMWTNRIGIVSLMLQTPVMLAALANVPPRGRSVEFPRRGTHRLN